MVVTFEFSNNIHCLKNDAKKSRSLYVTIPHTTAMRHEMYKMFATFAKAKQKIMADVRITIHQEEPKGTYYMEE